MTTTHTALKRWNAAALIGLLMAAAQSAHATTLASYNFAGQPGNQASTAATGVATYLTVSPITRGSTLTAATLANSMDSSKWNTTTSPSTLAEVLSGDKYYSFTVTPASGHTVSLSQLYFKMTRTSTGPTTWVLRSSLDGFSGDIATGATNGVINNVSLGSGFEGVASAVEFRLYAYGTSGGSGAECRLVNPDGGTMDIVGTMNSAAQIITLDSSMSESVVRSLIGNAASGSIFYIRPGASWTLTSTLNIPAGVSIIGSATANDAVFLRGFNGPMVVVGARVTLCGVVLDGNKSVYTTDSGPIIVAGRLNGSGDPDPLSPGVDHLTFTRVNARNNKGDALHIAGPMTFSQFHFCKFDDNDGYGVLYGSVTSHHGNNVWNSIHFDTDLKASFAFYGVEQDSTWTNCEWLASNGPVFEQFPIYQQVQGGSPVLQPTWGCSNLTIRGVMRDNGPVWLNRGGEAKSIVFTDCRMKHNATVPPDLGTTDVGTFDVEAGSLSVEVRGGAGWYDSFGGGSPANPGALFVDRSTSSTLSRLMFAGIVNDYGIKLHAANRLDFVITDTSMISSSDIHVNKGVGLNPATGGLVSYGP